MEYIDDYQSCSRTYATLLIYPSGQHPDEITELLGIEPSRTSVKGGGLRGTNVNGWFLSSKDAVISKDSRRHIDWILDGLERVSTKVKKLQNSGALTAITCFWESVSGNGGPTLSPSQMRRLAELNLEIWWDVYFNDDDDDE